MTDPYIEAVEQFLKDAEDFEPIIQEIREWGKAQGKEIAVEQLLAPRARWLASVQDALARMKDTYARGRAEGYEQGVRDQDSRSRYYPGHGDMGG